MFRSVGVLRWVIAALVAGVVVMTGLVVFKVVSADRSTPRTEMDRAVFAAEEAVKADPRNPTARVKLAAAYLERGNVSGAREQADNAVRLAPDDPAAFYVLGLAEHRSRALADAEKHLMKAASLTGQTAPFYQDVWAAIARVRTDQGSPSAAQQAINKALSYGPENVLLLFEQGQIYERAKDWTNAMDVYLAALSYSPDYAPAKTALENLKRDHAAEYQKLIESVSGTATAAPKK